MSLFVFLISLLIVAQHVSGNHVSIIRSWRLRDVIASCWYVPWLREGCQDRLAGSASMDALLANRSSLIIVVTLKAVHSCVLRGVRFSHRCEGRNPVFCVTECFRTFWKNTHEEFGFLPPWTLDDEADRFLQDARNHIASSHCRRPESRDANPLID